MFPVFTVILLPISHSILGPPFASDVTSFSNASNISVRSTTFSYFGTLFLPLSHFKPYLGPTKTFIHIFYKPSFPAF